MQTSEHNAKIAVNNILLRYSDEGEKDAPAIIFIHGFPFNKTMWNMQMDALKDNFRVIAYDVRGHGNSDEGDEEFSIELFASDLIGLMDELDIDKAILCGLSMGGYIALNAFENHPKRFEALVLCDTQCIEDTPETKEKRMKALYSIKENGMEEYANESINNLFAPESYTSKKDEVAAIREMIVNTSKESVYKTLLALAHRSSACNKLQHINVPVLVMVGNEDRITPPAASRLMHAKIENSVMFTIVHAGHVSNMENPEVFNEHLIAFLHQFEKKSFSFTDSN